MSTQNDVCPICLDEKSEDGEELRKLNPCAHFVHYICMSKWVAEGTRVCPLCRGEVYGLMDYPNCFLPKICMTFHAMPVHAMPVHTILFVMLNLSGISIGLWRLHRWTEESIFRHIPQFNIFCLLFLVFNPSVLYFEIYLKSLKDISEGNPVLDRLGNSLPVRRGQSLNERLHGLMELIHCFDQFELANHPNWQWVIGSKCQALGRLSDLLEEYSQHQTHPLTISIVDFLHHPITLILAILFSMFFYSAVVVAVLIKCINYIFI